MKLHTYKGRQFASRKHFKGNNNFKMYCVYRTFIYNKKDEYTNAKKSILEKHAHFEDFAYNLEDNGKSEKAENVLKIIDIYAFKKMHKLNNQYKHYFKRDLRNPFNFVLEIDY